MLLLSTSSLQGYWLHRIFSFAKKANFDGIDLTMSIKEFDLWDKEYLKSLISEFDIPVLSITAPTRWLDVKKVDHLIDIALHVWAQSLTFSPPHFSDSNKSWFTHHLLKVKRDTHLSISIQNVEPKFLLFIIAEYKNATLTEIKRITGDTSLDLSNIDTWSGMDIMKAQKILGSSIRNIYLSDKHWPKSWLLPGMAGWWISYMPLESFFMKLKTTWYNWFISLKVKPSELWAWTEAKVLQNLEFTLNYYRKHYLNYK